MNHQHIIIAVLFIVFFYLGYELECFCIKQYENKKITEDCLHKNRRTKVLDATCGCEKTVVVCSDCNEVLTEPKTEC